MASAAQARKQIMMVMGEASGDVHGAQLAAALLERDPRVVLFGVAGEQLQKLRFETLVSVSQLAAMGLVELAGNLKALWRAYRLLRQALRQRRPNLLVLIDFPDFNLRLARSAKRLGIPVLYYISPQIWAWRKGRVRQIARRVDRMAVVFPFEAGFYKSHGVNVTFVGHPMLDTVRPSEGGNAVLAKLRLDAGTPVIALLPGSRRREVAYHLPIMAAAARRLRRERGWQFVCVRASTVNENLLQSALRESGIDMPIVDQNRYDAMDAAELIWTASGTATLEAALLLKPMIIVYRLSWLTYGLARLLVRVEHIGMVNLIAGERLMPELVQSKMNPENIVEESLRILEHPETRCRMVAKLQNLRGRLGSPGAAGRVADLAIGMMA
jgi:lipid-A-disaccharide synthase